MENKFDKKLYEDYMNGNEESFKLLYNKYRNKVKYFIYNIIKDPEKAEDLTQETFLYIIQNKNILKYNFKYYIYLVAKSKTLNYIRVEKRRNEINQLYNLSYQESDQDDILEKIINKECQKELLQAIQELEIKYRNALYLVCIEGISYNDTAQIIGETLSNTKNLVHRGKIKLRGIFLKKGFNKMNKVLKIVLIVIGIIGFLSGIIYATTIIYKKSNKNYNVSINPTYESTLEENTINNLWIGTLDLAWKKLKNRIGQDRIDLEGNLEIVNQLNESLFNEEMLDKNDYELNIEKDKLTGGYEINTKLKKHLSFLEKFDNFSNYYTKLTFGSESDYIKYFGINNVSPEKMNENIEVLFYNSANDFAIKLKTNELDELILYRTDTNKAFNEHYNDLFKKIERFDGDTTFQENDELRIPYVKLNGMISYNNLVGKHIANTNGMYIQSIVQDVNFSLNESGCNLSSNVNLITESISVTNGRNFYFDDTFIIFMKEKDSNHPYFSLKIDNCDILEKIENYNETTIIDYTTLDNNMTYPIEDGEYKFFEDDKYEYYYPNKKSIYVHVYFEDGSNDTVEWALKNGNITIDLLNKFNIEYIKKKK